MAIVREEADARFRYLAERISVLIRGGPDADPWHVMKHPIYLYLVARIMHERAQDDSYRLKDRLYALNKALHGCSLFYKVRLPAVFFLNYATQVVLGDCTYGENLVVYQGVTVGSYRDKVPAIGNNVLLMPNSIVSGSTKLGDNVVISAGVVVVNQNVPDNTLVFAGPGGSGDLAFHPLKNKNAYLEYFIPSV